MVRVLFVCLGNICRSPMAQFILNDMVNKKGIKDKFYIDSAATSNWNELDGLGIYDDAKKMLKQMNIPFTEHKSRQIRKEDYDKFDYILAMEEKNLPGIMRIIGKDPENKVHKLLDFTHEKRDIADPWYTGDFITTYYDLVYGCEEFLKKILK